MVGAIVFIWTVMPSYGVAMAILSSKIVRGRCIPLGAYSSFALEKAFVSILIFLAFVLPLLLMVVLYARIVYTLKKKVYSDFCPCDAVLEWGY